ncbi:hypothetical protein ACFQ5Q_18490 [Luteolibacter ambystomatis]
MAKPSSTSIDHRLTCSFGGISGSSGDAIFPWRFADSQPSVMKPLSISAIALICSAGALVAWRSMGERKEERREPAERITQRSALSPRGFDTPGKAVVGAPVGGNAGKRDGIPVHDQIPVQTEGKESVPVRSERAANFPAPLASSGKGVAQLQSRDVAPGSSEVKRTAEAEREEPAKLPLFYSLGASEISKRIPQLPEETIKSLQTDFEQQAGVGSLEPEDPEYARRWKEAELTLEQQIRLWGGWAAWGAYEHQLAVVAYQQQKASGASGQ